MSKRRAKPTDEIYTYEDWERDNPDFVKNTTLEEAAQALLDSFHESGNDPDDLPIPGFKRMLCEALNVTDLPSINKKH